MKSPEMGKSNPELDALIAREEAKVSHYQRVPDLARTEAHHKEIGSQRRGEFQSQEFRERTDLQLMTPDQLIGSLQRQVDFATKVVETDSEEFRNQMQKDGVLKFQYEDLEEAGKNIPYIADQVESGEYPVSPEQKDHIYELLALLKEFISRLGISVVENYVTTTSVEAQLEDEQEEAA